MASIIAHPIIGKLSSNDYIVYITFQSIQTQSVLLQQRALLTLKHVVKTLAGRRLANDRKMFYNVGELLYYILLLSSIIADNRAVVCEHFRIMGETHSTSVIIRGTCYISKCCSRYSLCVAFYCIGWECRVC